MIFIILIIIIIIYLCTLSIFFCTGRVDSAKSRQLGVNVLDTAERESQIYFENLSAKDLELEGSLCRRKATLR